MRKPKIVTLECRPADRTDPDWHSSEMEVPVPDGWELGPVIQAGSLPLPDAGIRLQVILIPVRRAGTEPL